MNPLAIKPLVAAGALLIALAVGAGAGWTANGWRLGEQLAELKAEQAEGRGPRPKLGLRSLRRQPA